MKAIGYVRVSTDKQARMPFGMDGDGRGSSGRMSHLSRN